MQHYDSQSPLRTHSHRRETGYDWPLPSPVEDAEDLEYVNLDEVTAPPPAENPYEQRWYRHESIEDRRSQEREHRRRSSALSGRHLDEQLTRAQTAYDGLDEIAAPPPEENVEGGRWHRSHSIEEARSEQRESEERPPSPFAKLKAVDITTVAYLIFFSILGTLARLGLQTLTVYPNAPVIMSEIWANVGGCFVMGFLAEDKAIFATQRRSRFLKRPGPPELDSSDTEAPVQATAGDEEKNTPDIEPLPVKKTLPPYIGLTVGFCGSFTSFSSLIRDAFLALSNDLVSANHGPSSRNPGYSAAAVTAVLITEAGLSLAALSAGAHFAIASAPILFRLPNAGLRRVANVLMLLLGPGCWVGAILMAIWPVHVVWRGEVVMALVFAPLGCLLRFALALTLNGVSDMFPLGTFAANVFGTIVLGLCYDLQRTYPGRAVLSCQILQGVQDGFSGCLTTVSTWVGELKGLRRMHAYTYGAASVGISFAALVVIVGSLRWSVGFEPVSCKV